MKNQIYLGSEEFIEKMQSKIVEDTDLSEIPSSQKRNVSKPIRYYEKKYKDRDTAIVNTYANGGYSMKETGDYYK